MSRKFAMPLTTADANLMEDALGANLRLSLILAILLKLPNNCHQLFSSVTTLTEISNKEVMDPGDIMERDTMEMITTSITTVLDIAQDVL